MCTSQTDSVLLAMGAADGSIHVCDISFDSDTASSELCSSQRSSLHSTLYLLWPGGDSMPVHCIRWAEVVSAVHSLVIFCSIHIQFREEEEEEKLLAVKGSVIVLLSLSTDKMETDCQSERKQSGLVYGVHTMQVSGT